VKQFTARYSKELVINEIDWCDISEASTFWKDDLYHRVPPSVKRILQGRKPQEYGSVRALADALGTLEGIPHDIPAWATTCGECDKTITCPCSGSLPKS
jgi:hypothetical protein